MKLSENFSLQELTKSQTAIRMGLSNTLDIAQDKEIIDNLRNIAINVLEPIRKVYGAFRVSSGYRGLPLNTALKSKPTSQHVKGEAVDIEIFGLANNVLGKWIELNLEYDQLIYEFTKENDPSAGWIHVSLKRDKTKNRQQVLHL